MSIQFRASNLLCLIQYCMYVAPLKLGHISFDWTNSWFFFEICCILYFVLWITPFLNETLLTILLKSRPFWICYLPPVCRKQDFCVRFISCIVDSSVLNGCFRFQRGEAKLLTEDWEGAVEDLKRAAQQSPQVSHNIEFHWDVF